jgi:hypothetical protein
MAYITVANVTKQFQRRKKHREGFLMNYYPARLLLGKISPGDPWA